MLLPILLLPLVAAAPPTSTQKDYIIDIDNGNLKNVQFTGDATSSLDLSGLGIRSLERTALDNVSNLKSLNLANNSLEFLPEFMFSNLTSLEYLSLAENKLMDLKYLFVGLENLRTLNVSYNRVVHLRRSHLFGLTKSVTILTEGNIFWSMSMGVFTNSFLKKEEELKELQKIKDQADLEQRDQGMENVADMGAEGPRLKTECMVSKKVLKKGQKLKLCMPNQMVLSIEPLEEGKKVAGGCLELPIDETEKRVSLRNLGIKGFHEGWYQLQYLPVYSLDLSHNEIIEITKEVLNELPEDLVYVNLMENRIRGIWSNVIENMHLRMLNLRDNLIDNIEEDALQKTNLTSLYLNGNQLYNLSFVSSLPKTLTELVLSGNQITSIADNTFSNLHRLVYLSVANNKISKLPSNVFKGLDSLQVLILTRNNLMEIEHQAFGNLKQLSSLYLYRNSLSKLEKGLFSGLGGLKHLNLAWNKFQKITKDMFAELPQTLDSLYLDFNEIDSLEKGSFVNVPRFILSLTGNKISTIPQGTFDLPALLDLYLPNNTLITIDGDGYEGLPQLKRLWLSSNRINEIAKGSCKNLASLHLLDISRNPFQKLENGALYGLSFARGNFLYIYENQLKELQGGLFDDV